MMVDDDAKLLLFMSIAKSAALTLLGRIALDAIVAATNVDVTAFWRLNLGGVTFGLDSIIGVCGGK